MAVDLNVLAYFSCGNAQSIVHECLRGEIMKFHDHLASEKNKILKNQYPIF